MQWPVIHIVKRFGRVGGMESYVWHVVHGLVDRGIRVTVVCERVCHTPDGRINLLEVGASPERPRWKSMLVFRARVDQKIRAVFSGQSVLIHSHERCLCHQVTTFHGPPIEPSKGFGWLLRFNRRVTAWRHMERDELLAPNVQMILPVSSNIMEQLVRRYPMIMEKKINLAWPGVSPPVFLPRSPTPAESNHLQIGFVGKEWKRKGLDLAIRIVEEFRKSKPKTTLMVVGVVQSQVPASMRVLDWISFGGWSSSIPWSDFDLLIHPARKEPFGMVVAEARSHGIPVVMSSGVGAADLEFAGTKILEIDAPIADWCEAISELINTNQWEPEIKWSWSDLVDKHLETIYPQVKAVSI